MVTLTDLKSYQRIAHDTIKNTITWHDAYKAVHVIDDATSIQGRFVLRLGNLFAGQKVTFNGELYHVSGHNISIRFNQYASELYDNEQNIITLTKAPNITFEDFKYSFVAPSDGVYSISFGTSTESNAEYYLRDLSCDRLDITQKQKLVELQIVNGQIVPSDTFESFHLAKGASEGRYNVTYNKPFFANSVSGTFVSKSAGNPNRKIDLLVRANTRTGFVMQLYDVAIDSLLTWSQVEALTGTYYFSVLVVGYDT